MTKVIISIEGGVIQHVISNNMIDVIVIDTDPDNMVGSEKMQKVKDLNGETYEAYVYESDVLRQTTQEEFLNVFNSLKKFDNKVVQKAFATYSVGKDENSMKIINVNHIKYADLEQLVIPYGYILLDGYLLDGLDFEQSINVIVQILYYEGYGTKESDIL